MTPFEEGQGRGSEECRQATVRAMRAAWPYLLLVLGAWAAFVLLAAI
jgi:hypothetical protein